MDTGAQVAYHMHTVDVDRNLSEDQMQAKAKSNSVVTSVWRESDNALVFTVLGADNPEVVCYLEKLSAGNRARGLRHGMTQRLADAAAKYRDTKDFRPVHPNVKRDAIARLAEHYNSGSDSWSPEREAAAWDATALAAVVEVVGKSEAEVRAMIEAGATKANMSPKAYLAKLVTGAKVKPVYDRMMAEQPSSVDPDAALDEMMEEGA